MANTKCKCGAEIEEGMTNCPACGVEIMSDEEYEKFKANQDGNTDDERNGVATALKVYAVINSCVGGILSYFLADLNGMIAVIGVCIALLSGFAIYAFGEVIQLLHDIKKNTAVK